MEQGRPWSIDGDGALFRLVSEANRIRLAHLFDPVLTVHTSVVDPLQESVTHRAKARNLVLAGPADADRVPAVGSARASAQKWFVRP